MPLIEAGLQLAVSHAKRGSKGWKRGSKALRTFTRRQSSRRLDARLKTWTKTKLRGVSTKYLRNYLT